MNWGRFDPNFFAVFETRALTGAPKTWVMVADVSSDVGYEDVVAFRKRFLKWTGLTPSEYRTRYGVRTAPGFRQ